jgi:hypothetical protein
MNEVICAICKVRVSEWMMASGKTLVINGKLVHMSCEIDYRLRTGKKFEG